MKSPHKRTLQDLISVGPAIERDFQMLGVKSVEDLATRDPEMLYKQLCQKTGARQDPCVLDVFRAAVAQARDPKLPAEQCIWWYWSRVRKQTVKPS
jgi:predicted RecB family nuclease